MNIKECFSIAAETLISLCMVSILVAACSGGGGSSSNTTTTVPPVSGTLTDTPVQGVAYTTAPSGLTGTTDATGAYNYKPGDTVQFKLGSLVLGNVTATGIVSPIELANGNANILQNLLVLFQSLDSNGGASSVISIPPSAAAAVTTQIDLTADPVTFASSANTALQGAMTAGGISTPIVNTTIAITNFEAQGMNMLSSNIWVGQPADSSGQTLLLRFAANGEYLQGQAGPSMNGGQAGVEYGTASVSSLDVNGFQLTANVGLDTNLQAGLSDPQPCDRTRSVGDQIIFTEGTDTGSGCTQNVIATVNRAENDPKGIVGVWALDSPYIIKTQTFAFFSNGKYIMNDPIGDTAQNSCGGPGVEAGSYTYNASSKILKVSNLTYDTNGCAGLSDTGAMTTGISLTISPDGMTISGVDQQQTPFTLYRISGPRSPVGVGPAFTIASTSFREMSIGAAFDGTNFLVGMQGGDNSDQDITAQFVSKTGSLVGSRIALGTTGGAPGVAFDGTNYLLVWGEDATYTTKIFGQFVSTSGSLVGSPFTVASGFTNIKSATQVIFDGANYFVAWDDESTPGMGDSKNVYGQFVTPSGTLLGSVIPIATAVHGQRDPAIAFDGTNILTIWTDGRNHSACDPNTTSCYESDVYGQFITKSGLAAGTLAGGNFQIDAGTLPRDNPPNIAFDGTNYLITFTQETTFPSTCSSGCKWEAYGILVSQAGVPIGSKFVIGSPTTSQKFFPVPTFVGSKYLVTWTDGVGTTSSNFKGQYVTTSGTASGSDFTLFSKAISGEEPWLGIVYSGGGVDLAVTNWAIPNVTDPTNPDLFTNTEVLGSIITAP